MFNDLLAFSFLGLSPLQFTLVILCIVGVILLLLFVPLSRSVFIVAGCLLLCLSGVFSCFYSIRYFTMKSSINGKATEGQHNITRVLFDGNKTFDFKTLGFESTEKINNYSSYVTFDKSIDLKKYNSFLLNNTSLETTEIADDYIIAEIEYNFYDTDKNELYNDTLFVSLYTYVNSMKIEVRTTGGDDAVKYWNSFLIKNGFLLTLSESKLPTNTDVDKDFEITPELLLRQKLNAKINEYSSLQNYADRKNCIDEINKIYSQLKELTGVMVSTDSTLKSACSLGCGSFFGLTLDLSDVDNRICSISNKTLFGLKNSRIYSTTDNTYLTFPEISYLEYSFYENTLGIYDKISSDVSLFYGMNVLNYLKDDFVFDKNNIISDYYPVGKVKGQLRKDIGNLDLLNDYDFERIGFLCVKDTSVSFVNSFLEYILNCVTQEYENNNQRSFSLEIDVSNYFNNFVVSDNQYVLSNGSVYMQIYINSWR